jgi:hypothetical protein
VWSTTGELCGDESPLADPELQADPSQVDFGYVSALQFSEEVGVTLTNVGDGDLLVQAIRISENSDNAFGLQLVPAQLPLHLGSGASELISVYFAPPSSDMFLGWVEILTGEDDLLVPLGGCSTGSDCVVEFKDPPGDDDDDDDDATDDDDDTLGTPDINFNPGSINFGSIPQNQMAIGDVITISNTGDGPLDIDSVTLSSSTGDEAYFAVAGFSSGTLQPGGAPINLNVTFDPYGAPEGSMSAEVTVLSNDPDEGSITIPLSATVTEDCVGCPAILQVAGSVALDLLVAQITYVQIGTGTATVDIANVGTGVLQVEPITEGGAMCPDFAPISYVSGAPSSLAPGESATLAFSVGQEGLDLINLGSGDSFTIGTLAADFDSVFNWSLANCNGFP